MVGIPAPFGAPVTLSGRPRRSDHDYPRARATMATDQHTDRDGTFFDLAPDALLAVRARRHDRAANQAALEQAGR